MLIPAGNPSPWTGPTGNNTYLLLGAVPVLIDAGVGHPAHVSAIESALAGRPLAAVLVTHGHPDHAGGLPVLLDRWPRARCRNVRGDRVQDGENIPAGDTTLRAIHTPGHAPDHLCLLDVTGDLYCGDLARIGGTIVIPASKGGDLGLYLESLRRVRALAPRRLLPGHGPVIDDPAALIDSYLAHRAEREQQVVGALAEGLSTPAAIAQRVYGRLEGSIAGAAEDGVLAQLIKLEREGRARRTSEGWAL